MTKNELKDLLSQERQRTWERVLKLIPQWNIVADGQMGSPFSHGAFDEHNRLRSALIAAAKSDGVIIK